MLDCFNLHVSTSKAGHMLLVTHISFSVTLPAYILCLVSREREFRMAEKMYGNFFTVLGISWAPDTLLKHFEGATEEKQETNNSASKNLTK